MPNADLLPLLLFFLLSACIYFQNWPISYICIYTCLAFASGWNNWYTYSTCYSATNPEMQASNNNGSKQRFGIQLKGCICNPGVTAPAV